MPAQEYKITYRDGSTQKIKATLQLAQQPWLVFQDDRTEVLRVPATDIQSVRRADVADREPPATHDAVR